MKDLAAKRIVVHIKIVHRNRTAIYIVFIVLKIVK